MKVVKKAYLFMDNLYLDYDVADIDTQDWQHKESIKTVYLVIEKSELEELEKLRSLSDQLDFFDFLTPNYFPTLEEAEQNIKEEEEFYKTIEEEKEEYYSLDENGDYISYNKQDKPVAKYYKRKDTNKLFRIDKF